MKLLLQYAIILIFILSVSCGKQVIKPGKPMKMPPPEPSLINIPVEIPIAGISGIINQKIPQVLHSQSGIKISANATGKFSVKRNGSIAISALSGTIAADIPLKINGTLEIKAEKKIKKFGRTITLPIKHSENFSTDLSVRIKTPIRFSTDWSVSIDSGRNLVWNGPASINIKGVEFSIDRFIKKAVESRLNEIFPELDEAIKKVVQVRNQLEPVWKKLAEPVSVRKKPPLWISIKPVSINAGMPNALGEKLIVNAGVSVLIKTVIGAKPSPGSPPSLPGLTLSAHPDNSFRIVLPVSLAYGDAKKLLAEQMDGKVFTVKKTTKIHISKSDMYGKGDLVFVAFTVKVKRPGIGDGFKARLTAAGKPVFDPMGKTLKITKINYDVDTNNLLVKSADWLLHSTLLEVIEPKLKFSLRKKVDAVQGKLNTALAKIPVGKACTLSGSVNDLTARGIYLNDRQIQVVITAGGKLAGKIR
ncbi:MAG: DUF4403 family protein [bacterium]|nr:DUF4403 family protein [bacterium]